VPKKAQTPRIYVLAGTNGAGKSSVAGAMLIEEGVEYFNPDEAAELIRVANPGITLGEAQSVAWDEGRRLLERAINERLDYAFETTLGGRTIPALLEKAIETGIEVRIWYVGLTNAELHIARVHARVKKGGHDIPEEKIHQRYTRSVFNLIQLMPKLTELRVYDNSVEADPHTGATPEPKLIVHWNRGELLNVCELASTPEWAKPIVLTALTFRL
jgi:predicted ABC-type ATPase